MERYSSLFKFDLYQKPLLPTGICTLTVVVIGGCGDYLSYHLSIKTGVGQAPPDHPLPMALLELSLPHNLSHCIGHMGLLFYQLCILELEE